MQPVPVDVHNRLTNYGVAAHPYPDASIVNGLHLDLFDTHAHIGGPTQMDSVGFIAKFHIANCHHDFHHYSAVFGGTSECRK